MTAREGIQELYARYAHEMDSNNAEELADCFLADGVFNISGQGYFDNHEDIKELVRRTADGRPRHIAINIWIRDVQDGAAQSQAYFQLVHLTTGAIVAYGNYRDNPVRCDDGRWRFKERRVQFEWTAESYAREREPK